jgi:hypothetical protein
MKLESDALFLFVIALVGVLLIAYIRWHPGG